MFTFFSQVVVGFLLTVLVVQPIATSSTINASSQHAAGLQARSRATVNVSPSRLKRETNYDARREEGSEKDRKNAEKNKPQSKKPAYMAEIVGQSATRLSDGRWLLLGGSDENGASTKAQYKSGGSEEKIVLASTMSFARSGHAAVLLPSGNVLILGGKGADGDIVSDAEIFDHEKETFTRISIKGIKKRVDHSATLLTDASILIAGGIGSNGKLTPDVEFIGSGDLTRKAGSSRMRTGRQNHSAELRPDGTVLFKDGLDEDLIPVTYFESFDPGTNRINVTGEPPPVEKSEVPTVAFSAPGNGDGAVPLSTRPVLRFSKLLEIDSKLGNAIKLTRGGETVPAKLVPAENGRLLFLSPLERLQAGTTYYIEIAALKDEFRVHFLERIIAFTTEGMDERPQPLPVHDHSQHGPPVIDGDSWIPGDNRFKNEKSRVFAQDLPPLEASKNITALSGRVLSLSDRPLAGVTIVLQGRQTETDATGRFLLLDLKPGQSGMVIHGDTVKSPGKTYGTFEVLVDIDEGKTNVLPYTSYLPVIDKANEVQVEAPTRRETVVTTSRLPGMEVRIAPNSVLRMPPGHGMSKDLAEVDSSHRMTKLGITPMPVERTPFPLPPGVDNALLFTLQMHGAKVEGPYGEKRPGLRFTFPNSLNQPPGTRVEFWNYDSTAAGWAWYGYGTVTPDGRKVIPDPGVELEGMQCLSLMTSLLFGPIIGPVIGSHGEDGDPVDLQTGLFVYDQTDLVLPDTLPIRITRTYRQTDGNRDFGMGTTHPYNMFIAGDTHNYGNLILPNGSRIKFVRDHTNTNEHVMYHTETPTAFYKAELRYLTPPLTDHPEGAWEVRMRDGSRLIFARKTLYGTILGIHSSATALHQIKDRFGNALTLNRDSNLRLIRITSSNNKWVDFSYAGISNTVTHIRDNIGREVSYTYDSQNRLIKVTDVLGGESEYTYDAAHRMLTLKDARGVVNLTNEYDAAGRVKKQTSADGTIYQFAYTTPTGETRVVQTDVTNPRGLIRRMTFNEKGYPISETFGVGRPDAWGYTYERQADSNRILRVIDSWDQRSAFTYDEFGNMLNSKYLENTANEVTTSATYTAFDNVATSTDLLNRTSNFTYDSNGQLTEARDWLNRPATFTYNDRGQILTATDNLNRTSRFSYDRGALVESEDPTGRRSRQYIDNAGRVTRTFDPMGRVTKYRFNKANRPIHVTDPMGRTGALLHDAVGNILEITDSKGGKIKYTYDSMSRPLTRTDQLNRVETYQYDSYGNLWKATDHKNQVTEFTYDVFNRPTLVKYHDNSTTVYAYDEKARVSSVTDSAGGTITYGYDAYDRVNSETTANGTLNYAFDTGGRLESMKAPNQSLVSYGYDTADRIQSITQDGQVVSFTYDDADRRTSMTLPNGIVAYYTYDTASQLKSLTYKRGTTVIGDVGLEYDANGRRTHVSGSLAQILSPGTFDNTTYDAANQQNAVNAQGLTYDQNGNLTSDGTNTYTWNARDELVSISGPSLTASFAYDGEGRRISKTVNGLTTTYVYDGLQAVEEHQQSGPTTTQLAGGLDEVFFRRTGTTSEFLLTDALGSTWGLADSSGNVNTEYAYDVFGQTLATGQTSSNPLQFTGRENDGTGLYFYRNRYYSPGLRRFISRDPLREAAGENEYSYVSNNPVSLTDPLGLQEGPVNYLRNPFPPDYVDLNTASNFVSNMLGLDAIARSAWTLGNHCLPLSERLWAAAHIGSEIGLTIFGGQIVKGIGGAIFKRIPCNPFTTKWLGKACFVKGTLIHTKEGLVPIEEIKAGDEVLSYNEQTRQNEYRSVIETYIRQTEEIIKLEIEGESTAIETTPEHPFYVGVHRARDSLSSDDDGEWLEAGRIRVGDEVLSASGHWKRVVSATREARTEQVYNFAVEGNHNYFVSSAGFLVHNDCKEVLHHIASNKHRTKYTALFKDIVGKYGLSLNGDWNRVPISTVYHYSKHPPQYHDFVLDGMRTADSLAHNAADFVQYFDEFVRQPLLQNPSMLHKTGW